MRGRVFKERAHYFAAVEHFLFRKCPGTAQKRRSFATRTPAQLSEEKINAFQTLKDVIASGSVCTYLDRTKHTYYDLDAFLDGFAASFVVPFAVAVALFDFLGFCRLTASSQAPMAKHLAINRRKWTRGKDMVRETSPSKSGNVMFSDIMPIDSRVTSRGGTPMSVCIDLETDEYMIWEPVYAPTLASRKLELERLNYRFMDWELAPIRGDGAVGVQLSAYFRWYTTTAERINRVQQIWIRTLAERMWPFETPQVFSREQLQNRGVYKTPCESSKEHTADARRQLLRNPEAQRILRAGQELAAHQSEYDTNMALIRERIAKTTESNTGDEGREAEDSGDEGSHNSGEDDDGEKDSGDN
ncbi:uncharacterized protein PGRI_077260 [Penicillium griseofulvum]|uniref:Uncharacterized protein n=1 Tax=Penicillium patulum TaxID=5078 RepID=A0A135M038_PENPA|nr:uncharacterized protein PGRI_077260 [Penicillium griseofulvum]KXG54582.1 hypothetical protein PGRI_077260 [Penicillium griseofulvum]